MHSLINSQPFDFGYTGPFVYGHLWLAAVAVPLAVAAWRLRWPAWLRFPLLGLAGWAAISAGIVKFVLAMNDPMTMPTQAFLPAGGKVLDIGCGSGRATMMVLMARPQATVTALDNWSADYINDNSARRLLANARAIDAESRVAVQSGDMRSLPFPDSSFDGIVSTYAIDHLNRDGSTKALSEAARVLKPGGDFLLAVLNGDGWTTFTYGPHFHGGQGGGLTRWEEKVKQSGLAVAESGTRPWTVYILAKKAPSEHVLSEHGN